MTGKQKYRLDYEQQRKIDDHLRALVDRGVLIVDGETCRYINGTDDHTIAEDMDFPCSFRNVANMRKKLYGNLTSQPKKSTLTARMEDLEATIAKLSRRVEQLTEMVTDPQLELGERHEG